MPPRTGFLMEWLEGEALGAKIVRAPELAALRPRLADQCGEILASVRDFLREDVMGRLASLDRTMRVFPTAGGAVV